MTRSTYRVIYGDTDQMGVVYYANYLALFERGRCEYMRERNFKYAAFEAEGFILPVVEATCKYRQSARFDDLLVIETAMTATTRITFTFGYRIFRRDDDGLETLLAEGVTQHACLTKEGRPVRLPPALHPLIPVELRPV
jgi:acyl-CoA thioester hydrolase